jgi:hypothetical protein
MSKPIYRVAIVVAGVVALALVLNTYSSAKGAIFDGMESGSLGLTGPLSDAGPTMGAPHAAGGNQVSVEGMQGRHPASSQTYSETTLSSSELLPSGQIGATDGVSASSAADLAGQNFLQAGYHSNINIAGISQTNRNASWDLRTENPNPQAQVGPFLQTTISPNPFHKTQDGLAA